MTKRILVAITIFLFLASFTLPAFYIGASQKDAWSSPIAIFFLGWIGLMAGSFSCIAWLANPLFIIALILLLRNKKGSVLLSLSAMLFAASFLFAHTIIVSEAPTYASITELKAGYWLWLGSMGLLFVITFFRLAGRSYGLMLWL